MERRRLTTARQKAMIAPEVEKSSASSCFMVVVDCEGKSPLFGRTVTNCTHSTLKCQCFLVLRHRNPMGFAPFFKVGLLHALLSNVSHFPMKRRSTVPVSPS